MKRLFEISNLRCSYAKPFVENASKVVLKINKLEIPRGKKVFIVGESGIGKSTILETLGMMNNTIIADNAARFIFYDDEGNTVDLKELWKLSDAELSSFRLKYFSFIFQSTNLMRNFTVFENVSLTRMLQGYTRESSFEKAKQVLVDLGLEHINETRMPQELSGGQQQRLAFARAIIPDFTVLFGDEPTGNLDSENAEKAMALLSAKLDALNTSTAIIVSHDMHLAASFADLIVKIRKVDSKVGDEIVSWGEIDEKCIFVPDAERISWSNGEITISAENIEKFLKGK